MVDRDDRGFGVDVDARHHDRQRGAANHRREPPFQRGGIGLGRQRLSVGGDADGVAARLARRHHGYRRIYMTGLAIFTVASLFCAGSVSLPMLATVRALQGVGAACLFSVNAALLRAIYPRAMLGRGLGINAFVIATSAAAGPTVAGGILAVASWRWLFLINVPLGLAAWTLA